MNESKRKILAPILLVLSASAMASQFTFCSWFDAIGRSMSINLIGERTMTKTVPQTTSGVGQASTGNPKGLTIDYQLYEQYLEDSGLSDEQKKEFLNTLWQLVVGFVDLGFGVHPLQQACEQPLDLDSLDLNDVLPSKGSALQPAQSITSNIGGLSDSFNQGE